jgi:hypothetical protein
MLWAACFAPQDKFDDFVAARRSMPPDASVAQEGGSNTLPLKAEQLTGTYLYAISVPLAPELPTVYLAEITAEPLGDQLQVTTRQRPLHKSDRKTPVGDWGEPRIDVVSATGEYTTGTVHAVVPKEANAITGSETTTETVFSGTYVNPATPDNPDAKVDFFCGTMNGRSTAPLEIDLSGSTFAAIRLETPDDLSSYPPVVLDCAMTPAKALP